MSTSDIRRTSCAWRSSASCITFAREIVLVENLDDTLIRQINDDVAPLRASRPQEDDRGPVPSRVAGAKVEPGQRIHPPPMEEGLRAIVGRGEFLGRRPLLRRELEVGRRFVDSDDPERIDKRNQRSPRLAILDAYDRSVTFAASALRLDEYDLAAAFEHRAALRVVPREPERLRLRYAFLLRHVCLVQIDPPPF